MSIYALPGPLFKLVSNGVAPSAKPKETIGVASSATELKSATPLSSFSASGCADNPLSRRPNEAPRSDSSEGRCSSHTSRISSSSSPSSSTNKGKSNVVIAVKEAKIDHERLIRSLSKTATSSSEDSKKTSSTKAKLPSDSSENSNTSPSSSSSNQRRRRGKNYGEKCDPHEEAIKFEFSVAFNGREYTATRSLPRILQFRYDLIQELGARRMWRERRRKRKESVPPALSKIRDLSDDEEEEKSIPEIPRLSEDATGRSGFTMLYALLRPYGPALEGWLKKVIDIVPHDSQILTQFLWEPLSPEQPANNKKLEKRRSSLSASCSSLGAILETGDDDDDHQYDSDTEDQLLNHS